MLRLSRDLLRASDLDDLALIHHRNAGRKVAHDRHVVRDEQIGKAEIALQLLQKIHNLRADTDVQRRNWLIGDDKLRPQGESAGNSYALPLPSRKFVRITRHGGFIHPHSAQKFRNALAAGIAAETFAADLLMKNERLGDHVLYPEARVKRTERVLEDDLHIAPNTPQFRGVRLQQIDALEEDPARSRLDETEDEASQRTLARAGFTNQAQRLAFMNVEGNIVD